MEELKFDDYLHERPQPHSVLIEPINEFTIYLPPKVIG
jgi:hypothetical protein